MRETADHRPLRSEASSGVADTRESAHWQEGATILDLVERSDGRATSWRRLPNSVHLVVRRLTDLDTGSVLLCLCSTATVRVERAMSPTFRGSGLAGMLMTMKVRPSFEPLY